MNDENQLSGAASDTGNVLEGTTLGALLNGAAVGFSINYERVPQSIADLEHAAKYLEDQGGRGAEPGEHPGSRAGWGQPERGSPDR